MTRITIMLDDSDVDMLKLDALMAGCKTPGAYVSQLLRAAHNTTIEPKVLLQSVHDTTIQLRQVLHPATNTTIRKIPAHIGRRTSEG